MCVKVLYKDFPIQMLEEMHDPVLSQPICHVQSEPPLLSSEKFLCMVTSASQVQCGPVLPVSHSGRSSRLFEETLSRCVNKTGKTFYYLFDRKSELSMGFLPPA